MIQLELDSYESLLEIQPTSKKTISNVFNYDYLKFYWYNYWLAEYEVYIEKIKAGTLKNSGDQSDDNKNTQETQADLLYIFILIK